MNIVVASHQRSGTHLAIDLVRNNINGFSAPYLRLGEVARRRGKSDLSLARRVQRSNRIVKTHRFWHDFTFESGGSCAMNEVLSSFGLVYVVRDGRDVLVSEFLRRQRWENLKISFQEFLTEKVMFKDRLVSRPLCWALHVTGWLSASPIIVRFEEMLESPLRVVSSLHRLMGMSGKLGDFVDVRLQEGMVPEQFRFGNRVARKHHGPHRTSIAFRKGTVGDHSSLFTTGDYEFFSEEISAFPESRVFLCE